MGEHKALWLVKGLGRGGTERILSLAVRHADRSRFTVDVAFVQPWKDAMADEIRADGITVHCLGQGPKGRGWARRLQRLLAEEQYDIVHTHSPLPAVAARLAPAGKGAAFVHTEHSAWSRYRLPTRAVNAATFGRNFRVFAVSEGVAASIARPAWAPWVKMPAVEVLYHGIDEADVRRGPEAKAQGRQLLGLPADAEVLGTVGNLAPKKDQHTLIDAFAIVAADRPAAHLVIVGGGPLHDELVAHAASLGLADRVHLPGQRPDVPALLPAFDVFALSSIFEGLGLALVEAMASGLPVVATAVDGVPEVVTDGVDGLLVPPARAGELAAAVSGLLDDPARAAALAEAAVKSSERFSIAAAVERMEAVYDVALLDG